MKACWIDAGNDPQYEKLAANGINAVYFDCREQRLTPAYMTWVADHGFKIGIYAAWNWQNWTGPGFAEYVHGRLLQIGWKGNASVCLDIETHDVNWILSSLLRWRQLRPTRLTDWTMEPMQGGLFTGVSSDQINKLNIGICPQYYGGAMQPFAADVCVLDLIAHGFSWERIIGMYDAKTLPLSWDGYAYTMGRLP